MIKLDKLEMRKKPTEVARASKVSAEPSEDRKISIERPERIKLDCKEIGLGVEN